MILRKEEQVMQKLGTLYETLGYTRYKMSKFEEYDLYVRNRDSLISDGVITFTDRNGKLLALKPDVTMSIIKNGSDMDGMQKVYYNENVYRVSKGTHSFKEIMQAGLECIGDVDSYSLLEVLDLACRSLECVSDDYVLDISNMEIISQVTSSLSEHARREAFLLIGNKNLHELSALCEREGMAKADVERLTALAALRGAPETVLPALYEILGECECLFDFERIVTSLKGNINIDFSVIDDINYYNGILFKGFVRGVESSVLSGGQYDVLMKKMGRRSKAVGFAVYLDLLERLDSVSPLFDADAVLLYDDGADIAAVLAEAKRLTQSGMRVIVTASVPANYKYKQLLKLSKNGVEIIENNA